MYLYRDYLTSTSLGNGERAEEGRNKKYHRKEDVQSKSDVPLTNPSTHISN